jgi:hypothetical protein
MPSEQTDLIMRHVFMLAEAKDLRALSQFEFIRIERPHLKPRQLQQLRKLWNRMYTQPSMRASPPGAGQIFRAGEFVPTTGIYLTIHGNGHRGNAELIFIGHETFRLAKYAVKNCALSWNAQHPTF